MSSETISASKLATYLSCARRFAFRYVENVPPAWKPAALAFGSAVHSALQSFHEDRMSGRTVDVSTTVGLFLTDFEAQLTEDVLFKNGDSAEKFRGLGDALIRAYAAANEQLQVRAVEASFEIPLVQPATGEVVGPNLRGVFDLILESDVVVELKTAARAWDQGTLTRNIQLSAYAYAYRQINGRDPNIRVVALLKQAKPRIESYVAKREPAGDGWFVRLAVQVSNGITAGIFPPNPGWQCGDCEYQRSCSAWGRRESF